MNNHCTYDQSQLGSPKRFKAFKLNPNSMKTVRNYKKIGRERERERATNSALKLANLNAETEISQLANALA